MSDLYDVSKGPKSESEFLKLAKEFDFIHLALIDLNGIPRVNALPADVAESLVCSGKTVFAGNIAFTAAGEINIIPEIVQIGNGDIRLRPIVETARSWPWLGKKTGTRILQVLAVPEWLNGEPLKADPRSTALKQLKRLHDRGLDILLGWELEFRLYKQEDVDGEPTPIHTSKNQNDFLLLKQYEEFYVEVNKRIRALGFRYEKFHVEHGVGILEISTLPEWGIKAVDDMIRLKMVMREVALDCGFKVTFMTKVSTTLTPTPLNFSHSIWRRKDKDSTPENVMDGDNLHKMSPFAQHWTAGLLNHANALSALMCQTVNCFRFLHYADMHPHYADWATGNRLTVIRVKNINGIFLEHRCPTSAANPYLVFAGVVAAGLDGVDRKLPLVDEGSKEMGLLPYTLPEALEDLLKDAPFRSALGEEFCEWYVTVRQQEVERLKTVDIRMERQEDFLKEREAYYNYL